MRITAGELRNRVVKTAPGIRPSQDMVRQAIYSVLAGKVAQAQVLDLYAGSGALGLEAWSRGAASVTWVENEARAFAVLRQNAELLAGNEAAARCVRGDVDRFLASDPSVYDIVLADPPYEASRDGSLLQKTLRALSARPMVRNQGVLVFEQGISGAVADYPGWRLVRNRTYGGTRVLIFVFDHAESSHISGDL